MHLAASLFDSWIFLLLVGVASLLRWLASRGKTSTSRGDPQEDSLPQPERPAPEVLSSDEEQIRKFLEALGQPRTAKPPPPLPSRTDIPPRPVAPVTPPRAAIPIPEIRRPNSFADRRRRTEPKPAELVVLTQPKPSDQPTIPTAPLEEAPVYEVDQPVVPVPMIGGIKTLAETPASTSGKSTQPSELMQLLRSSRGLRQAIILREIFGKPRSLQPFEDLPGTA